jgi:ring-1,2-phenylacetyl-CoA epoxidase subunit PaaA
MQVISGNGPCNRQRLQHHVRAQDDGQWVRDAMHAYEMKRQARDVA